MDYLTDALPSRGAPSQISYLWCRFPSGESTPLKKKSGAMSHSSGFGIWSRDLMASAEETRRRSRGDAGQSALSGVLSCLSFAGFFAPTAK